MKKHTKFSPTQDSHEAGIKGLEQVYSHRIARQQHPDYHEGFYDACAGEPLHYGMSPEYRSGWLAAHRCKRIFKKWEANASLRVLGEGRT